MAQVTQVIFGTGSDNAAQISVTFDNTTGAISQLSWVVNAGTLTVVVTQSGQPDLVRSVTTTGSTSVPPGYNLTPLQSHGITNWVWQGTAYDIQWKP